MPAHSHLSAVYDEDLEFFLKSVGLWGMLEDGNLLCQRCGKAVTFDSIAALTSKRGDVGVVCDDCVLKLMLPAEAGDGEAIDG